ncbi:hypothetical protein BFJ68_g1989 [Fusarium oxysporum]|uniref:Uncharacterized protein n=1 Tax=Fusarium oxysporum TaxID=5507 RepID=A0A420RXF0_FUSOX|nr:hypothetical protein BFJ68_g1989 [Fusarium oxysporum]
MQLESSLRLVSASLITLRSSPQYCRFKRGHRHSGDFSVAPNVDGLATLDAFNIEPVVINENAGQHMMDHNLYSISATVVPESSAHQLMFNSTAVEASQEEYYTTGKGVYTAPGGITKGFPELSGKKL